MTEPNDWLIWALFTRLRRYKFPLGPDDYEALRLAMNAGFGWESLNALRTLCALLWAKSLQEREVVFAIFDQIVEQSNIEYSWELASFSSKEHLEPDQETNRIANEQSTAQTSTDKLSIELQSYPGLPPIFISREDIPRRPLVFLAQYPVSYREVAQAFRRLRKPIRKGPKVVLDVEATIDNQGRMGVTSPAVMTSHRLNTLQLVLLIDRFGSMLPFHKFLDHVAKAIIEAARLETVSTFYFHDTPAKIGDYDLLKSHVNDLMPLLDTILNEIQPSYQGQLYRNENLLDPVDLHHSLKNTVAGKPVIIISDAGAGRRNYDPARILDTISFIKSLKEHTQDFVWLNPLSQQYWKNSTAEQIARYIPMFTLDVHGLYRAVNTLRGQPYAVERPL